jgi:predicted secreted protein
VITFSRKLTSLAVGACLALSSAALAHEVAPVHDQVSFQVERSRDVANDWATATVGITAEDSDPARLADRVNGTMRAALERARAAEGIEVRSGGYRTHPVTDGDKITRWRASQDLLLESGDIDALSGLIGALQEDLQLRGIQFGVSDARRRETEAALVAEALAAFRERAAQVQQELGARGWSIVTLHLQTQGGEAPHPMEMRNQMFDAAAAPPAFEGGDSTLRVFVNATIELER